MFKQTLQLQKVDEEKVGSSATTPLIFSATSSFNTPTSSRAQKVKAFLKLVAEGEQNQAETLLQKNRDLALVANDVTDLSGRIFKGITGFQYAVCGVYTKYSFQQIGHDLTVPGIP